MPIFTYEIRLSCQCLSHDISAALGNLETLRLRRWFSISSFPRSKHLAPTVYQGRRKSSLSPPPSLILFPL